MDRQIARGRFGFGRQFGVDGFDAVMPGKALENRPPFASIDPELQFPSLATCRQFRNQGEQIVAIRVMATGDEGELAFMFDDAIIRFGEAELIESIVERALRGDQQGADMKLCAFGRFVCRFHSIDLPRPHPLGQAGRRRTAFKGGAP